MHMLDGLEVLDAHHPPDGPREHEFAELHEVGCVAEHVADRHDLTRLPRELQDFEALFLGGRDGLFQEDVVPHPEGLHARSVMEVVRGGDDDGIGELRTLEDMLPGDEAVLVGDRVRLGVALVSNGDGLGHPHDLDLLRVGQGEVPVDVSAGAGPQGDGGDGLVGGVEGVGVRQDQGLAGLVPCLGRPREEGASQEEAHGLEGFAAGELRGHGRAPRLRDGAGETGKRGRSEEVEGWRDRAVGSVGGPGHEGTGPGRAQDDHGREYAPGHRRCKPLVEPDRVKSPWVPHSGPIGEFRPL